MSYKVIGAAIEVHKELGPGLLESAYEECLCHDLAEQGIPFERQVPLPVIYKGKRIDCAYRMDIVIDNRLIVELKSVESIAKIHRAQLMSYLKLAKSELGLLINFNVNILNDGISRISFGAPNL